MDRQAIAAPAVKIGNLVKRYKEFAAVNHLSLEIRQGEIFGLLGPNGSGKTTTINCLLQLLTYDHGTIEVFGEPITPTSYRLKRRIGVVPQDMAVFEEMSVRENIDSFCSLYESNAKVRRNLVDEAIAFVGLEKFEKFRPKKLSGGLQRRLNIACGIAHRPDLIIFDEPTVAVDPQSRNAILDGIERLNKEGATVIYTTHYMEEAERLCDRISIIDNGHEIAAGTADELKAMIGTGEKISLEVSALDDGTLGQIQALEHVRDATLTGMVLHISCTSGATNLSDILAILTAHKVSFARVLSEPPTLNDVFLEITGRELRDEA
ncbi:ABC transporter ATP-binding protein [Lancefieldella rimae]|uniref:ABC transporter ATP-binding protein n=1 Tax=Lancefieldella rimae TaxID=1383 RepID=UPI0028ED8B9F|nr:ABC transporter ATP-binding protein [Lancefieldella rimae]